MPATIAKMKVGEKDPKLGARMRALREGLKMSERDLVEKSGLSPATIKKLESGGDPKLSELCALAIAFDYTPGGLVKRISD